MDKLVMIVILVVLVFILTYDPKSGTLDKYLKTTDCSNDEYRAANPGQCKVAEYDAVQFARAPTAFMKPSPTNSVNGAIIRQ